MLDVDDTTFTAEVLEAGRPVVVDFWAPWCGPCKTIEPLLEQLAAERPGIGFVRVDVEASPGVADRYGVLTLPTVIVFAGGEPREHVHGAAKRKRYEQAIAKVAG
jgi:thioredoxin 1